MRFSMAKMAGSNNRKRPYGLLLLLALGMAVMCAVVLHQLREGRVLSLLIQERDQQLATLQILLQKERENSKEMKRKIDDMKAKTFALRNQKMELADKLADTRNIAAQLKKMRTDLEAALVEKQIQVDKLKDEVEEFILTKLKVANLTSLLKQKEVEVEEMKRSLAKQALVENSTAQNEKSLQESLRSSEERKGEWAKFQINKDEVDLKAENVRSRNQEEAEKKLNYSEGNQTVGIKEVNGTEEGKSDAKKTEETVIHMKENESDRMERADHSNVEEINGKLKSPEGSELAAKNDSENAVKDIAKYEKIIGSSSNQSQYDLTQKTRDVEEMERIKQVTDKMGDENREAKNDKQEEDQMKKDDESSKAEGPSSSSKGLQLQETDNSEVGQSSQKDGDGFTETMQKEAGKEAKSIGQSETVENTEESVTESKTSDEKQAESKGQSENAENLED